MLLKILVRKKQARKAGEHFSPDLLHVGIAAVREVGVKTEQPNQSYIWYNFTFQWGHQGVGDGSQSPGSTIDFTTWFVMFFAYLETVFLGVTVIPKPEGLLALRIIFFRFQVLGLMESLELRTLALRGQKHTYVLQTVIWPVLPLTAFTSTSHSVFRGNPGKRLQSLKIHFGKSEKVFQSMLTILNPKNLYFKDSFVRLRV